MILYLNGTSSSGKSSIAHEIQKQLNKPIFYFSIDTLLYALNSHILETIQGKGSDTTEINWNSIFTGYFECVRVLDESGNLIIADCPVYLEGLFQMYENSLKLIKEKYVVGLDCPLEVLKQREIDRKDRALGIAEKQFDGIHKFLKYDCIVNTANCGPYEIAEMIINNIKWPSNKF